jgi:hypothetical protein
MITNSPSIQLRDDEPLWRFLKLPPFFVLLEGSLSLPTLANLQKGDPEEGNAFVNIAPDGAPVVDLSSIEDWLERNATEAERAEIKANTAANSYPQRTFVQIWKRELAKRRCVWCWHRDPDNNQSRAMWHIYADRGIAIRSDLATIKSSLKCDEPFSAFARQVEYVDPHITISDWSGELDRRPFLLKNKGYHFENEVRIVFAVEAAPAVHHFEVDAKQLIKEIVISPHLFRDEQSALANLIKVKLGSSLPISPLGGFSGDLALQNAVANFRKALSPFNFAPETPDFFKHA